MSEYEELLSLSLDTLMEEYTKFHDLVEKTPDYQLSIRQVVEGVEFDEPVLRPDHMRSFFRELHAVMGMAGEGGEALDIYKKRLFGKNAPIDHDKVEKEVGDLFWYLWLYCKARKIPLSQILAKNIVKLRERYLT